MYFDMLYIVISTVEFSYTDLDTATNKVPWRYSQKKQLLYLQEFWCSLYPRPGVIFTRSLTSNINFTLKTTDILITLNYCSRFMYPRVLSVQPLVLNFRLWPNFQFVYQIMVKELHCVDGTL